MILLDQKRIARTSKRMAYQIAEEAGEASIHVIGLNERGYCLACEMLPVIDKVTERSTSLQQLTAIDDSPFELTIKPGNDSVLVIVDDVIFSGRTIQKAIDKIEDYSKFSKIYVAVLVDRGHRKYPIQAAIVGSHIPTKLNEHVEMKLDGSIPHSVELIKK